MNIKLIALTNQLQRQIDMRRKKKKFTKNQIRVVGAMVELEGKSNRAQIASLNEVNINCVDSTTMQELTKGGYITRHFCNDRTKNANLVHEYSVNLKGMRAINYILTGKES